jgi:Fur family transcriptional regulator, ferric uptake regulator
MTGKTTAPFKLDDLRKAFEKRGLRMTRPRQIIAEALAQASDHPDVEELHRRCQKRDAKLSLATVYRSLKLFEQVGIVERHGFQDGRARFEHKTTEHHDHLIDVETGKVIEFHSEEIETLQAEIAARLGFSLVGHKLELYGKPLKKREPR